jgi:hypothetical protein
MQKDDRPFGIVLTQITVVTWILQTIFMAYALFSIAKVVFSVLLVCWAVLVLRGLHLREMWSRWVGAVVLGALGSVQLVAMTIVAIRILAGRIVTDAPLPMLIPIMMGLLSVVSGFCLLRESEYFSSHIEYEDR